MALNNSSIFGAFTLNDTRGSRITGDWVNKETIANYGWWGGSFGGGGQASPVSIDRVDFSNDSVTVSRGAFARGKFTPGATSTSNYGWFASGGSVDRIDFSNDAATALIKGNLTQARTFFGPAATGNSNYGWFAGGYIGFSYPNYVTSTIDRIDYANDASTASVRSPLGYSTYGITATGNSNYGWFGGGAIDRLDFSNDLILSRRGSISVGRGGSAATGNSNYGWFTGGSPNSPTSSRVDRIDFANDLPTSSPRGPLTSGRYRCAAMGNSDYGWCSGDKTPTQDRIDFANDSVTASVRGPLTAARGYNAGASGVLNIRRQKAGNFGWWAGGSPQGGGPQYATVERINFLNDLAAISSRGGLVQARKQLGATENSNYGWFAGGTTSPGSGTSESTVDRINFSNDLATGLLRSSLSVARLYPEGTGNSNYGWFGGGLTAGGFSGLSRVDRMDFSNDSISPSVRGSLSSGRGSSATGNSNYGWFSGATAPGIALDRIDFSNDSTTASVRGSLSSARGRTATGNSNYGWFGGSTAPPTSRLDRIDFSNDLATGILRGPLVQARDSSAVAGNSNYGWWGGGCINPASTGGAVATVDRVDFSNDSVTASQRSSLSFARTDLAAVSNTTR